MFWPGGLAFPQISAPARPPRPLFPPSPKHPLVWGRGVGARAWWGAGGPPDNSPRAFSADCLSSLRPRTNRHLFPLKLRRVATCEVHWTLLQGRGRELGARAWGRAPDNSPRVFSADCLSSLPPSRTNRLRQLLRGAAQASLRSLRCTCKDSALEGERGPPRGRGGGIHHVRGARCDSGPWTLLLRRSPPPLAPLAPVSAPPETLSALWEERRSVVPGAVEARLGGWRAGCAEAFMPEDRPGPRETRHPL